MFFKSLLKYAIVLSITHQNISQAASESRNRQTNSDNPLVSAPSLIKKAAKISDQDVTIRGDKVLGDSSKHDKKTNRREFPSSLTQKSQSDEPLNSLDDYFISYDNTTPTPVERPECILSRSKHYLSWWVAAQFYFWIFSWSQVQSQVGQRRRFVENVSHQPHRSECRFHGSLAALSFRRLFVQTCGWDDNK